MNRKMRVKIIVFGSPKLISKFSKLKKRLQVNLVMESITKSSV